MGLGFRPELAAWAAQAESWTTFTALVRGLGDGRLQLMLFGLLLSANEANLVIRAVFDQLDLKPRSPRSDALAVDEGEFNRGRVIGMLELSVECDSGSQTCVCFENGMAVGKCVEPTLTCDFENGCCSQFFVLPGGG